MIPDARTRRKLQNLRARMQAHVVAWFAELDEIIDGDAGPTTMPADIWPETDPQVHAGANDRRRR